MRVCSVAVSTLSLFICDTLVAEESFQLPDNMRDSRHLPSFFIMHSKLQGNILRIIANCGSSNLRCCSGGRTLLFKALKEA